MNKRRVDFTSEDILILAMIIGETLEEINEPLGVHVPRELRLYLQRKLGAEYQDVKGLPFDYIVRFVGNRKRWNSKTCKAIVMATLSYLCGKTEESNPIAFSDYISETRPAATTGLAAYGSDSMADSSIIGWSTPTLILNDKRIIAIKNKISYPNITKAREEQSSLPRMPKWLNMRYEAFPSARLLRLPDFKVQVEYTSNFRGESIPSYTVEPKYDTLPGFPARFAYCTLAEEIQCLVVDALRFKFDDLKPTDPYVAADLFALYQLIFNRQICFYLINDTGNKTVGLTFTSTTQGREYIPDPQLRLLMTRLEEKGLRYEERDGKFTLFAGTEPISIHATQREMGEAVARYTPSTVSPPRARGGRRGSVASLSLPLGRE